MLKKIYTFFALMLVIVLLPAAPSYANKIFYSDKIVAVMDKEPVAINGKAYISAADVAAVLGTTAVWDGQDKSVNITTPEINITFLTSSNEVLLFGQKIKMSRKIVSKDGKVMLPVTVFPEYFSKKVVWDKDHNLLIDSNPEKLIRKTEYKAEEIQPKIKQIVGDELYNLLNFEYLSKIRTKGEKFLTDGEYYVFKAYKKIYPDYIVNGFYFYNVLTDDIYFYPMSENAPAAVTRYFPDGKSVKVSEKKGALTNEYVANAKLIAAIDRSGKDISKYSYEKVNAILDENKKLLPKNQNYYYYRAFSKDEKNKDKKKAEFDVAQNAVTLETYIFLKDKDKTNIIKL